jgi:DNA-binding LytR/AlgR family response regulator
MDRIPTMQIRFKGDVSVSHRRQGDEHIYDFSWNSPSHEACEPSFFWVEEGTEKSCKYADILSFEEANGVIMHTKMGGIRIPGKLIEIKKDLDKKYFLQVHQNHVVNAMNVGTAHSRYLTLKVDGPEARKIKVGPSYFKKVSEFFHIDRKRGK